MLKGKKGNQKGCMSIFFMHQEGGKYLRRAERYMYKSPSFFSIWLYKKKLFNTTLRGFREI
jgi:hypothetical protein